MPSIAGQHVVVLGGTSGFGFATAKAAIAEGARVTIASRSARNCEVRSIDLAIEQAANASTSPTNRCSNGFSPASASSITWR